MAQRRAIVGTVKHGLVEAVSTALDWFYPPHCQHCSSPLAGSADRTFCRPCLKRVEQTRIRPPVCAVCGRPLNLGPGMATGLCVGCSHARPNFDLARSIFPYGGPVESLVKSYKFDGASYLGPRVLELAWAKGWVSDEVAAVDAVVHVPLHPKRERERGYDQALLLARAVGRLADKPLLAMALRRVRYTDRQTNLSALDRWQNVRGAFGPGSSSAAGLHVLLVDDVMTTGATVGECARVLKRSGAGRVTVMTLARAGL